MEESLKRDFSRMHKNGQTTYRREKVVRSMRKIFFTYACLLTLCAAIGGFVIAPPAMAEETVIRENLYATVLFPGKAAVVAGERGGIYRSADAGSSWQVVAKVPAAVLNMSVVDGSSAWGCGESGLLVHTTDGGKNWQQKTSGVKTRLFAIDFYSAQNGVAVGEFGKVLLTGDGGNTWRDVSIQEDITFYGVAFSGPGQICVFAEMGRIFRTTDSGRTWSEVTPPMAVSWFAVSRNKSTICAAGLDGVIICSADRGLNWKESVRSDPDKRSIYGLTLIGQDGVAVGESGKVLLSHDGGKTWASSSTQVKAFHLTSVAGVKQEGSSSAAQFLISGTRGMCVTPADVHDDIKAQPCKLTGKVRS